MPDFKEELLQFAWQHKLLKPGPMISSSGREILVLHPGELNRDSGPDFCNARIKLDDLILAGNIEVHIRSSDWLRHNHHLDKSYDTIILHVVYENDLEIPQNRDNNVEILEIKDLIPASLLKEYEDISSSKEEIPCRKQLAAIDPFRFTAWLQRMFVERLEGKTQYIETLFRSYHGDFQQTFYTILMRNFGFKVNALPFELLAKYLPTQILLKHCDNKVQLEALLIGMTGLLEKQHTDAYILNLQNEFEYLRNKYKLTPLESKLFKFSKLRPANFATLRLAQMAELIHSRPELFSAPHTYDTYEKISTCFKIKLSGYWKNHYDLDGKQSEKELGMGEDSISNIVTNTFATFFFFYFRRTNNPLLENVPFQLLEQCPFEDNVKTRPFREQKAMLKTGADSQALINLVDQYCSKRRCLDCGIAMAILNRN